jgi:prophage endopeptidase
MSKFTTALISVILALIIALWYSHARIGKLNADVKEITMIANDQKNALEDMQRQRVKAADFDIKITKELANAKNDNEHLSTSMPPVQKCINPPPPPAALMQPAPDLMTPINQLFSISQSEPSAQKL